METILILLGLAGIAVMEGSSVGAFMAAAVIAAALWLTALVLTLKDRKPRAKEFALKAAAYTLLIGALFGLNSASNHMGRRGAERIAGACEAYKARKGIYPASLAQLEPEYIKNLPPAKISLRWSRYWIKDGQVMYVGEPGLVVVTYDLAAKTWGHLGMYKMLEEK